MMHASRLGVDSHGVRLLPYYLSVIASGEVNGRPRITVERKAGSAAVLDADGAIGHLACFRAMEEAVALARDGGVGAVTIRRMSHMGAAGAYALWAAEQGMIGFLTANSDAAVRLHDGRDAFHGTSPIAGARRCRGAALAARHGDKRHSDEPGAALPVTRHRPAGRRRGRRDRSDHA